MRSRLARIVAIGVDQFEARPPIRRILCIPVVVSRYTGPKRAGEGFVSVQVRDKQTPWL